MSHDRPTPAERASAAAHDPKQCSTCCDPDRHGDQADPPDPLVEQLRKEVARLNGQVCERYSLMTIPGARFCNRASARVAGEIVQQRDEALARVEGLEASVDRLCLAVKEERERLTAQLDGARNEASAAKRERDALRVAKESMQTRAETAEVNARLYRDRIVEERRACAKLAAIEAGEDVGDWTDQSAAKGRHFAGKAIAAAILARGGE